MHSISADNFTSFLSVCKWTGHVFTVNNNIIIITFNINIITKYFNNQHETGLIPTLPSNSSIPCALYCFICTGQWQSASGNSKTVINKYVSWFWCERIIDGLFHWRKHYYGFWPDGFWKSVQCDGVLVQFNRLRLKCLSCGFVSYKHACFHFTRC